MKKRNYQMELVNVIFIHKQTTVYYEQGEIIEGTLLDKVDKYYGFKIKHYKVNAREIVSVIVNHLKKLNAHPALKVTAIGRNKRENTEALKSVIDNYFGGINYG